MTGQAIITVPEYTETAKALAELEGRMVNVVHDVTTGKGMAAAKKDVAELRGLWVALEDRRKAIKAPALERCRLIDAEAKQLESRLKDLAEPIKAQIDAEERRKEHEKAAKEQAERERVQAIHDRFNAIKALPLAAVGKTAAQIKDLIAAAERTDVAFTGQDADTNGAAAAYELRLAIAGLRAALDAQLLADQEAQKIAAERAELERLRKVAAEQQAELDRQAEAERERLAEAARQEEAAARTARAAEELAARQAREAEQARIDAERAERRRQEDAEREAAAHKLREEQEAARRDREKLEADKKAAAKKAREQAIANASLTEAATEALSLLIELGEQDHLTTQKLAAALKREPAGVAA